MIKHSLFAVTAGLILAGCSVDTTGLTSTLTSTPHPDTNQNAAVTVVEYADLQCPACKAAKDSVMDQLIATKGEDFSFEFRHFPLSSIHRFAMESAEAAECAGDQGKFWEFVDLTFENQATISPASMDAWGEELSLDRELFGRCRESHIKRDAIQQQYEEGRTAGVRGTPTFFVNGQQVPSTTEALTKAIDDALNAQADLL